MKQLVLLVLFPALAMSARLRDGNYEGLLQQSFSRCTKAAELCGLGGEYRFVSITLKRVGEARFIELPNESEARQVECDSGRCWVRLWSTTVEKHPSGVSVPCVERREVVVSDANEKRLGIEQRFRSTCADGSYDYSVVRGDLYREDVRLASIIGGRNRLG